MEEAAELELVMARKRKSLREWKGAPKRHLRDSDDPQVCRLIDAASAGEVLDIVYLGGSRPGTSRQILPRAVYFSVGFGYYVEAYDYRRKEGRTFRVDRIQLLGEPASAPRTVRSRQLPKPQPAPKPQPVRTSESTCFIATCVYESEESWQVLELRSFRDVILQRWVMGRALIQIYEFLGPFLASLIGRSGMTKRTVRFIISAAVVPLALMCLRGKPKFQDQPFTEIESE